MCIISHDLHYLISLITQLKLWTKHHVWYCWKVQQQQHCSIFHFLQEAQAHTWNIQVSGEADNQVGNIHVCFHRGSYLLYLPSCGQPWDRAPWAMFWCALWPSIYGCMEDMQVWIWCSQQSCCCKGGPVFSLEATTSSPAGYAGIRGGKVKRHIVKYLSDSVV